MHADQIAALPMAQAMNPLLLVAIIIATFAVPVVVRRRLG